MRCYASDGALSLSLGTAVPWAPATYEDAKADLTSYLSSGGSSTFPTVGAADLLGTPFAASGGGSAVAAETAESSAPVEGCRLPQCLGIDWEDSTEGIAGEISRILRLMVTAEVDAETSGGGGSTTGAPSLLTDAYRGIGKRAQTTALAWTERESAAAIHSLGLLV